MRLPTPVYERIPQLWFLLGLLFIANGLYLGIDFTISKICIAAGVACITAGIGTSVARMRYRRARSEGQETEAASE